MTTGVLTLEGSQAELSDEVLGEFRMAMRGDVITPGEPGYAELRPPPTPCTPAGRG